MGTDSGNAIILAFGDATRGGSRSLRQAASKKRANPLARILIVDDEPDIRYMIRVILEGAGYEVSEARDGAAGLASVESAPPDLVITDVMMPTMDGLEFIERLRSDPNSSGIPILVVSGNSELAVAANARLRKPFLARELLSVAALLIQEAAP